LSPPPHALFPYTTLFRSSGVWERSVRPGPHFTAGIPSMKTRSERVEEPKSRASGRASRAAPTSGETSEVSRGASREARPEARLRSEEHTSELQSRSDLVC